MFERHLWGWGYEGDKAKPRYIITTPHLPIRNFGCLKYIRTFRQALLLSGCIIRLPWMYITNLSGSKCPLSHILLAQRSFKDQGWKRTMLLYYWGIISLTMIIKAIFIVREKHWAWSQETSFPAMNPSCANCEPSGSFPQFLNRPQFPHL